MRSIKEIVWHCTATPEGRNHTVADVRKWHKQRGWDDIGYHFLVDLDGKVQKGRPVEQVGAHVAGHNTGTIGCVYVGGVDKDSLKPKDTRTPAQKAAMLDLTKSLLKQFPAIKKISGHNEYAQKACPCFPAAKEYAALLAKK